MPGSVAGMADRVERVDPVPRPRRAPEVVSIDILAASEMAVSIDRRYRRYKVSVPKPWFEGFLWPCRRTIVYLVETIVRENGVVKRKRGVLALCIEEEGEENDTG